MAASRANAGRRKNSLRTRNSEVPVAAEHAPDPAKDRTFLARTSAVARRRGHDSVREARERQRLQPDRPGPGQLDEEQALAPEEHVFESRHHLDVIVHRVFKGNQTAGVRAQHLTGCELLLDDGPARMHEGLSAPGGAAEPLEYEPFAAEEP